MNCVKNLIPILYKQRSDMMFFFNAFALRRMRNHVFIFQKKNCTFAAK
jgi:hypothetical protein